MQLGLAHGALEPEQEAIIEEGWMIDALCIADQRVGEAAEVDEPVPIGVIARQARDLESEHEADVGERDCGGEGGGSPSRTQNRGREAPGPGRCPKAGRWARPLTRPLRQMPMS